MKLKASGVIEPDFKIKEGKKKKEDQGGNTGKDDGSGGGNNTNKSRKKDYSTISVADKSNTNKNQKMRMSKFRKPKEDGENTEGATKKH